MTHIVRPDYSEKLLQWHIAPPHPSEKLLRWLIASPPGSFTEVIAVSHSILDPFQQVATTYIYKVFFCTAGTCGPLSTSGRIISAAASRTCCSDRVSITLGDVHLGQGACRTVKLLPIAVGGLVVGNCGTQPTAVTEEHAHSNRFYCQLV